MIDSPRSITNGSTVETDVCVVGAGAAGITLALDLMKGGLDVCLLEAGGLERNVDSDDPYEGENVGRPYSLTGTRLRFFGGTTNHWGGWCRPLDGIDFRHRRYVPWSGWPIERSQLDRFYERATEVCEIEPYGFDLSQFSTSAKLDAANFEHFSPEFNTKLFRFSPPTRFGKRYRREIEESSSTRCILDSTVVDIETRGGLVDRLHVRSGDKNFFIKAGAYVVASGGIENARLLLASNRQSPHGLGNDHDIVGRFFCDHIGLSSATILTSESVPYVRHPRDGVDLLPHLSFRDQVLDREELLNFGAIFIDARNTRLLDLEYLEDPRLFELHPEGDGRNIYHVVFRLEPVPNPNSRVTLTSERDTNGMPRVRLDWQPEPLEAESLDRTVDLFARLVGAAGLGRARRLVFGTPDELQRATYSSHHMGTTRMADDPKRGVVDSNCRVHGVPNLYVAGSSVFPTCGFANPTLTIVALAARLAKRLTGVLR